MKSITYPFNVRSTILDSAPAIIAVSPHFSIGFVLFINMYKITPVIIIPTNIKNQGEKVPEKNPKEIPKLWMCEISRKEVIGKNEFRSKL